MYAHKCARCGRFTSTNNFGVYVPWGNSWDDCEPDPLHFCLTCLTKFTDTEWAFAKYAWIPIRVYRDGEYLSPCSCSGDMMEYTKHGALVEVCCHCQREYITEVT